MKNYLVQFGFANPQNYAGLSPTFIFFQSIFGNSYAVVAPGVSELGVSVGLYSFGWTATTFPVAFKLDGGATLSATDRYVSGILDPIQAVDEKIGTINDSFGSTVVDPTTIMGYLKRALERDEGTETFVSSTGVWMKLSRTLVQGVTTTATGLFSHTITNSSGTVTKS